MSNSLVTLSVDQVGNVLEQLEDAYFDIPFENSDFQNKAFVMAAQQTPARAYRAIGLRMFSKIRAIKEYMIQKERDEIDIEEWEAKIADENTSEFDRRRAQLDIIQKREQRKWGEKLLNDALRELSCLHHEFSKFPKYDRLTFEKEEANHFMKKLTRAQQVGGNGAQESLMNMTDDLLSWNERLQIADKETRQLLGQK